MAQQVERLIGDTVYDAGGDKIGKVKRVYVDNMSGQPTWAAVSTGLFSEDSLVPLSGASIRGDKADELQVRVRKDAVQSAPHLEREGLITPEAEDELFVHYGIDPRYAGWGDYDTAGGTSSTARSEEQPHVGTEQRPVGKARRREHAVTEEQTGAVPTTREEVPLEREPSTEHEERGR